jgi:hypothetical protein
MNLTAFLAFSGGSFHSDWEYNHPHYPLVIAGILIAIAILLKIFKYKD